MKVLQIAFLSVFLMFLVFPPIDCLAQDEIEKISLDPNKRIIRGDHQIPSPKAQKKNLTAKASHEDSNNAADPVSVLIIEKSSKVETGDRAVSENPGNTAPESAANKLTAVARRESLRARIASKPLTDIYRVGVGDILDIRLLNSTAKDSTLFTVLDGGLIDYPLAGEPVTVSGLTTEEIADLLSEKIKLYDAPELAVGVRDYASHKIVVSGSVEKPGVKIIRREAVPLFTVLAEAVQLPTAARASIIRSDKETITVNLKDLTGDILVYDGDLIKILNENPPDSSPKKYYFIAGLVASPGQKEFHNGLTVTQAILAAGGTTKALKAVIMRQNENGFLVSTEVDLKLVKNGKMQDMRLENGDRIEIK
ncbi:MAG: polysaccharide biosynthesis/export family protein [Acidobacteriota bacterium]|nr:polysaccharide biosynthesis/export family protein [Acidobacteriota bacterium]